MKGRVLQQAPEKRPLFIVSIVSCPLLCTGSQPSEDRNLFGFTAKGTSSELCCPGCAPVLWGLSALGSCRLLSSDRIPDTCHQSDLWLRYNQFRGTTIVLGKCEPGTIICFRRCHKYLLTLPESQLISPRVYRSLTNFSLHQGSADRLPEYALPCHPKWEEGDGKLCEM